MVFKSSTESCALWPVENIIMVIKLTVCLFKHADINSVPSLLLRHIVTLIVSQYWLMFFCSNYSLIGLRNT